MKITHEVAPILAVTVEAGVILLLFLVPVLVICTWIILRCTRKFSQEAEAVVRSAEESSLAAFLEHNGPAIIRRLGSSDGRQDKLPGKSQSTVSLLEDGGEVIDVDQIPESEEDYGRSGLEEEMKIIITMEPQGDEQTEGDDPEDQFKPLGSL